MENKVSNMLKDILFYIEVMQSIHLLIQHGFFFFFKNLLYIQG